jgi:hypothetical protein
MIVDIRYETTLELVGTIVYPDMPIPRIGDTIWGRDDRQFTVKEVVFDLLNREVMIKVVDR